MELENVIWWAKVTVLGERKEVGFIYNLSIPWYQVSIVFGPQEKELEGEEKENVENVFLQTKRTWLVNFV